MTLPASVVLENIANNELATAASDGVTLKVLLEKLGEKSLVLALLIFTLPNCFSIPGVSSVLAVIMWFIVLQIIIGRKSLWIPAWLGQKKIPEATLALGIRKSLPVLRFIERFSRPRMNVFASHAMVVFACVVICILTAIIFLPLSVVGNLLPALCVSLILVGMLERDGLIIIIGSVLGIAVIFGLSFVIIELMLQIFKWAGFGV